MKHLGRLALGATLLAGACSSPRPEPPVLPKLRLVASLEKFDTCDDFLAHVKKVAKQQIGPWGLGGGAVAMEGDVMRRADQVPVGAPSLENT